MAANKNLRKNEEVARAGMHPYWDEDTQRATPSAFKQAEVSVSRLAILNIDEIVSILRSQFDHRSHSDGESKRIRGVGTAIVEAIIEQAEVPMKDSGNILPNIVLTVIEDAIDGNNAHALICGWERNNRTQSKKITAGVANRLLKLFDWKPC